MHHRSIVKQISGFVISNKQIRKIVLGILVLNCFNLVSKPAPYWEGKAVVDGEFKDIKLTDYKGEYSQQLSFVVIEVSDNCQ